MSVLFKIGNNDYSGHVVNATYQINLEEISETYQDCNEVTHYIYLRSKVKGKFDMAFSTQTEYDAFITAFWAAKNSSTNSWSVIVTPNNTLIQTTIDARVTFEPVRELTISRTDIIRQMTVNIEER